MRYAAILCLICMTFVSGCRTNGIGVRPGPKTGTGVEWDGSPSGTTTVQVLVYNSKRDESQFTVLASYSDRDVALVHHNKCHPACSDRYYDEVLYSSYPNAVIKITTQCGASPNAAVTLTDNDLPVGCGLEARKNGY